MSLSETERRSNTVTEVFLYTHTYGDSYRVRGSVTLLQCYMRTRIRETPAPSPGVV